MTTPLNRRILTTQRWTPPPAPADAGRSTVTADLTIERAVATGGHSPEDVKFDAAGRVVAGLGDGTVIAIDPATGQRELLGDTGSGQVLGVFACPDGSVLACNHDRGLFRVRDGIATALLTQVDGEPLTFASNVTQAQDGTIYLTTSSARWHVDHFKGDLLEHSCTGRLIRLAPDGAVTVLLDGLAFANGVVLAPDESHLVFAQTGAYSLTRYWLAGPRAETTEVFADSLPGFPDNMSVGSDGLIWVAIASPRNALLDRLVTLPGPLRTLIWNLPEAVQPKPEVVAWAMAYDFGGTLTHDLRRYDGEYTFVTGVAERDGMLVLSSLHLDDLAVASVH